MKGPTVEQRARTQRLALLLQHLEEAHGVNRKAIDYNNAQIEIEGLIRGLCGKECRQ